MIKQILNTKEHQTTPDGIGRGGRMNRHNRASHLGTSLGRLRPSITNSFIAMVAAAFAVFAGAAGGYGQCVSWIGNEYTSLGANTCIGDSPLFEIQTWPQSSGETVQLEIDYQSNGYDTYVQLPWVGSSGNNNKWNKYVQMTQSGTHKRRYRWYKSGCSDQLTTEYAFTVLALTTPSGQSATASSGTQIGLAWTKGVSGGAAKDTLILRSTSSTFTDPTPGTGYSVGNTIGSASVIYKSDGTSFNDTPLSANTQYYYKFYAENYSYYSAGVTASAWTLSVAPTAGSMTPDNASPCANSAVTWTAVGGFGAGNIQKYKYVWDQNATHTWTESEADWSSGTLQTTPTAAGTWYLHVKGYNGASPAVANGTYDYSVTANALPAAPDANYNRGPGVSLKIPISNLTTDTIQSLGAGSQSATITKDGTHIYYQPQSGNNNNDSFTYTAANTYCTKQGTITVTVVPATGQAQQITVANGVAMVNFAGIPGYPYIVQRAENSGFTVNVTTVLTTNAPSDGLFICTNSTSLTQAYYRLKYNPPNP